jgi:hypothetical protein
MLERINEKNYEYVNNSTNNNLLLYIISHFTKHIYIYFPLSFTLVVIQLNKNSFITHCKQNTLLSTGHGRGEKCGF